MGFCSLKERKKYEEQGILEDGDTDYRDGADGTGDYIRRERLRRNLMKQEARGKKQEVRLCADIIRACQLSS